MLDALKILPRSVIDIVEACGRPDLVCDVEGSYVQIKKWCDAINVVDRELLYIR